jgi:hypothetical protein
MTTHQAARWLHGVHIDLTFQITLTSSASRRAPLRMAWCNNERISTQHHFSRARSICNQLKVALRPVRKTLRTRLAYYNNEVRMKSRIWYRSMLGMVEELHQAELRCAYAVRAASTARQGYQRQLIATASCLYSNIVRRIPECPGLQLT